MVDCVSCMSNDELSSPFFLSINKSNSLAKIILKQNNVGEKSVAHIKPTFCFPIQVHGIEENIERQQGVIWLLLL